MYTAPVGRDSMYTYVHGATTPLAIQHTTPQTPSINPRDDNKKSSGKRAANKPPTHARRATHSIAEHVGVLSQ